MKRALRLYHSALIALLLVVAGCGQHKERMLTNSLQDGLNNSNRTIKAMIDVSGYSLEERVNDPLLHNKTIIWVPKIKKLQAAFNSCIAAIDSLSTGATQGTLAETLATYQQVVRSITTKVHLHSAPENVDHPDDTLLQQAMLSRIKNDVLIAQYDMVKYCLDQLSHKGWCIDYDPQLMISGSRIRRSDTIPQTTTDPIEYKFVANHPPGSYYLPVQIHYSKPDGTVAFVEKTFIYTILR